FFFSSRRRHTRWPRDWSSDVCSSDLRGRDLGGFVADVRRAVSAKVSMPESYYVTYGGQFENQARATKRLALIVPLVLLLIAGLRSEERRVGKEWKSRWVQEE